jgi:hypothetical protein
MAARSCSGPNATSEACSSCPRSEELSVVLRLSVKFFVDGTLYKTATTASLPAGAPWVFDNPFFLILNVAVGGNFPGAPDAGTQFPQQMMVDYVRVSGS